jgi:protein-S-isoprenylcysteine O-methyltransferase Ste14
MRPGSAFVILWGAFALSWAVAALWSDRTIKIGERGMGRVYRIVLLAAMLLFVIPARGYIGPLRLWSVTLNEAWICVAVTALGLGFAWWARIHLGRLWSASIARKEGHRVVDTGPYGIVRHPIYTGGLLAAYATAIAKGTVLGVAGAVLATLGFWMKARLEERWLREELEPGAYDAYSRRVPMLLPFGPK